MRFSGDGREIVAGGKGKIYGRHPAWHPINLWHAMESWQQLTRWIIFSVFLVYDIESRTVLHSVRAHQDDVNSVCFAEPTSSQVVFSGSDDHLVKVW